MRIAVVSDIHGNLAALEAVHRDIHGRGADLVVNLGDNLSGPLLPRETAEFLMAEGWLTVAGDHDRRIVTQGRGERSASDEYAHSRLDDAQLEWLRSLPATALGEPDVLYCHGTPFDDTEYLLETVEPGGLVRAATAQEIEARLGGAGASLVLCGHSHTPRAVRTPAGRLVVNPGSVGLPAYDDEQPYPHVVETGSPDARYAIVERQAGAAGWVAALCSVPYDHGWMARLARERGRPDWEIALLTGYRRPGA